VLSLKEISMTKVRNEPLGDPARVVWDSVQERTNVLGIGGNGKLLRQFNGKTLIAAIEAGLRSPALLDDFGIAGAAGYKFVKVTLSPATQDMLCVFGKPNQPLQTWTRELIIDSQKLPTLPQETANVENPITKRSLTVEHGEDWAAEPAITWSVQGSKMIAECHAKVSAVGPLFTVGQKFEFKVGDLIVGNGFRGTVKEVCSGQLDGRVVVGLPGGSGWLASSYPDCYPAIYKGVEVVTEGRHVGQVKEVSPQFVTQNAGRGKLVAHEVGKFVNVPRVGETVDIQYKGRKAVVAEELDQGKGTGR
jgi:hypothetical protein